MTDRSLRLALVTGIASLALLAACDEGGGESAAPAGTPAPEMQAPAPTEAVQSEDARFDEALESVTQELFRLNPTFASMLNIPEAMAGGRYKDRFGTPGIAGYREGRAFQERATELFASFDPRDLSGGRAEYLAILMAGRDAEKALHAIAGDKGYALAGGLHSPYIVTQIGGLHIDLPQFMTQGHGLASRDDAQAYIARLDQFYEQFAGAIELIDLNAAAGVLPPDYALEGAIRNAGLFIATPPEENPLYTHFTSSLDRLELEDEEALREGALAAIESSVYPAYEELIGTLNGYLDAATHDAGIWDIPGGPELYALYVRVNGESKLTPDGVHRLGLAEVARIQAEMEAIFQNLGMTEGTAGERLLAITQRPDQVYPNTPAGKAELLDYVRALATEAEKVMADYFLETPSIGFEVRAVPAYAEQGAPGGYYNPPAEDGSRPGLYFINLRDTAAQPKFSLPTLTYHEGVPGHHFQLALGTDAKGTPLLVRQAGSTGGMAEGWALYSERFAKEIGLYADDQLGDLGRLRDELFRAVRLVVDSGMHAKKWSREEAIAYMVANAGMNPGGVATEIERYSVWPGQALSYKTGMLRIQALRARAEEALGEDFDVASFHYHILRGGGAPLDVLEQRIDAWIAEGGPVPDLD